LNDLTKSNNVLFFFLIALYKPSIRKWLPITNVLIANVLITRVASCTAAGAIALAEEEWDT
jgi:hypothetical protein